LRRRRDTRTPSRRRPASAFHHLGRRAIAEAAFDIARRRGNIVAEAA
jgi:hypothetical protein